MNATPIACDASLDALCLVGRYQQNEIIAGRYQYAGCYNDSGYFRNIDRNRTFYIYLYYHHDGHYYIGPQINNNTNVNAYCTANNISKCSYQWYISNPFSDDGWEHADNVYFGECNEPLYNVSYCSKSPSFTKQYCINFEDTQYSNINGEYKAVGCIDNEPYFKHQTKNLYISWDYDDSAWIISDSDNIEAYCEPDLDDGDNLRFCDYWCTLEYGCEKIWSFDEFDDCSTDESSAIIEDREFRFTLIATLVSVIVFICCIIVISKGTLDIIKRKKQIQEDNTTIQQSAINDKIDTKMDTNKISSWKNTLQSITSVWWFVFMKVIFKLVTNIFDFYTDFVLSIEWINGYTVTMGNGSECVFSELANAEGYALLILSSIGLIAGLIGLLWTFILEFIQKNKQKSKWIDSWFTLAKLGFEDLSTMILCLNVGLKVKTGSFAFYQAFYMSVISMFIASTKKFMMEYDGLSGCINCHNGDLKTHVTRFAYFTLIWGSIICAYIPMAFEDWGYSDIAEELDYPQVISAWDTCKFELGSRQHTYLNDIIRSDEMMGIRCAWQTIKNIRCEVLPDIYSPSSSVDGHCVLYLDVDTCTDAGQCYMDVDLAICVSLVSY